MLIGRYYSRLTFKGRTALPINFRKILGKKIIIARWYEGCLVIVSISSWQQLMKRLTAKVEIITRSVRDTDRFILGSAFEVELDNQGRFVIPKDMRDYAKLKEEIIFLGLGDRVEIWDRLIWEEKEVNIQKESEKMIEEIAKQQKSEKKR